MSIDSEDFRSRKKYELPGRPQNYFDLMERVGSNGRYQYKMMLNFIICWFVAGIILLSNAFVFRNPEFDCAYHGLLIQYQYCTSYVCELPKTEWKSFISPEFDNFNSVATLDSFFCEDKKILSLVSSCTYIGAFFGYIILSFFADNYGRKKSILVSWFICTIGILIVTVSFNIYTIGLGLFLSGFGGDAVINITLLFFSEGVENKKRQKYSVIVQIFFAVGALIVTFFFYVIDDWRIIWCMMVAAPAIIELVLLYCYLEQTPRFLLSNQQMSSSLEALNRIGKINYDRKQTLQQEDIESVLYYQIDDQFRGKIVTHLDLFRFPSLRYKTVACSIIAFMTYALYYGPTLIGDQTQLDIYANSILIQTSELLAYVPAYALIQKIERKKAGIILFSIAALLSFFLVFLQKPDGCKMCAHAIVEIVIVFLFRACISFFFCIFNIYICQLFPSRVRALGIGVTSAAGSLATLSSPFYVPYMIDAGLNIFNLFLIFCMIAIGCLTFLQQTKGKEMKEQIFEVNEYMQQKRQQIPAIKESPKIKRRNFKTECKSIPVRYYNERMIQSNRLIID